MTKTQNAVQLYRLGNQPQEYEVIDKYLGWKPEWCTDWEEFLYPKNYAKKHSSQVTLMNSQNESVHLLIHQKIIKDAFPMSVHGEKRFARWHQFAIVSLTNNPTEKFIIPLH